jgi:hypothetical protein
MNAKRTVFRALRDLTHHTMALTTLAVACCAQLHASASGTLPWEKPMTTIATSLSEAATQWFFRLSPETSDGKTYQAGWN